MEQLLKAIEAIQEATDSWWLRLLIGIYCLRQALRWIKEASADAEQLLIKCSHYLTYVFHNGSRVLRSKRVSADYKPPTQVISPKPLVMKLSVVAPSIRNSDPDDLGWVPTESPPAPQRPSMPWLYGEDTGELIRSNEELHPAISGALFGGTSDGAIAALQKHWQHQRWQAFQAAVSVAHQSSQAPLLDDY